MKAKITTTKQVIHHLKNDIQAYGQNIDEMLEKYFIQNPEEKAYWLKWFNGNDMKEFN